MNGSLAGNCWVDAVRTPLKSSSTNAIAIPDAVDAIDAAGAWDASNAQIIDSMQRWLRAAVIGLNLCPFARAVDVQGRIRYAVSRAASLPELLDQLEDECHRLVATDAAILDTTLLIAASGQDDFLEFNFTLAEADRRLRRLGLDGVLQIASFHPRYEFADMPPGDITHCTNRAPWPTLHLLRESSVEKAVAAIADPSEIYDRNRETLRRLGPDGWAMLMAEAMASKPADKPDVPTACRRNDGE